MTQGSKDNYSAKQKRQAKHIEASEKERGVTAKKAEQIAWATVNKQTGGAKNKSSAKKTSAKKKT